MPNTLEENVNRVKAAKTAIGAAIPGSPELKMSFGLIISIVLFFTFLKFKYRDFPRILRLPQ